MDQPFAMPDTLPFPPVTAAILAPLARAACACPELLLEQWQTTCLSVQGRRSVFRFAGIGRAGSARRPWSLILKVLRAPADAHASDAEAAHVAYWPRESLLYAAGLPQQLTGSLRAPCCYGVAQPEPDTRWIWLEDLTDCYDGAWSLERYALAAQHLGQFNGWFVGRAPLPGDRWLSRDGLRGSSAEALASLSRLGDPALWAHPLVQRAFGTPVRERIERLAVDREPMLQALARLPQSVCHRDAWHGNMAAIQDADGADTTVLFDWALAGYGALGEEIGHLVWVSLLECKVDVRDAAQLEGRVFERYVAGLAESGWQGDPRVVRCAYLINAVLNFGLWPEAIDHAVNEEAHAATAQFFGRSIEAVIDQTAAVTMLLLDRADEVRALLGIAR